LNLTSTANVAAVVQYLHNNNLGANGTVAFTATIGTVSHTYVFEQGGASANAGNDILVDLAGVTLTNLSSLITGGHVAPAGIAGESINLGVTHPTDYRG